MARLDIQWATGGAEAVFRPGERIRGRVTATFDRDVVHTGGVWLRLGWNTSGPASTERETVAEVCLAPGPFVAGESLDLPFDLPCPPGPFSASHKRVSVEWTLEARVETDRLLLPVRRRSVRVAPGPCAAATLGPAAVVVARRPAGVHTLLGARKTAGELVGGALALLPMAAVSAWREGPPAATWVAGGLGGAFLVAALALQLPRWAGRRFAREVSVELPGGTELQAGRPLQAHLTLVPARDGWLRGVHAAWALEESGLMSDRGEASNLHFEYEQPSPFAPCPVDPVPLRAGEPVSLSLDLEAPSEPSFHGRLNRLTWALLLRLRAGDGGELLYRVPVTVRPPAPA